MGRLTLNVLLSFAQFEREVTGERIRDKIAASKKKGLWMGGVVPYGYRVEARKLLIEEAEASEVRALFARYLELKSLPMLVEDLRRRGFVTRARPLKSGPIRGGVPLTIGPLGRILDNPVYIGEIRHRDKTYQGEHEAIIDRTIFESVQVTLHANRNHPADVWRKSGALLMGKIFDDKGNRMTPGFAVKRGVRYRYYTSIALLQRRKSDAGSVPRVPAREFEAQIITAIERVLSAENKAPTPDQIRDRINKVIIHTGQIEVRLETETIFIPWQPAPRTRLKELHYPTDGTAPRPVTPIRAEARARLLNSIAKARLWLDLLFRGDITSTTAIATRENISDRHVRQTLALAFLDPVLVRSIVNGTAPFGTSLAIFKDVPLKWQA